MHGLVDVVIPAHNAGQYIASALGGVIAQTYPHWRMTIVDDGSNDNTQDVLVPYVGKLGARLRVISQQRQGVSAARNTAIRHSTGEFIALLDADDIWLPERLSEGLRVMEGNENIGLAFGRVSLIDEHGASMRESEARRAGPDLSGDVAMLIYTRKIHILTPTVLLRRRCLEEVGLFDETLRATEDRDLYYRVARRYSVAFIDEVLAYYRRHSAAMSADQKRMRDGQLRFVEKHYQGGNIKPGHRRIALSSVYHEQGHIGLQRRDHWRALADFGRAAWYEPLSSRNLIALAVWGKVTASRLLGLRADSAL